jgi:hypothetical protein
MGKNFVLGFIERQRVDGASDKEILHKLLGAGWPADIIMKALEHKTVGEVKSFKQVAVPRSKIYHLASSFRSFL